MPDLQVIMQAKRIVFVKNVILGPAEKWKVFPKKYFSILDGYYNMQYFVLNVTDSMAHLQDKNIPSTWNVLNTTKNSCAHQSQSHHVREISGDKYYGITIW